MSLTCTEVEQEGSLHCEKCAWYREYKPNCQCEKESVCPEHSPGPVGSDEVLIRTIWHKEQWDASERVLDPAHFSDVKQIGFSVNRRSYVEIGELRADILSQLDKKKKEGKKFDDFWLVAVVRCEEIRELFADEQCLLRLFCVYDTAEPERVYHADVCQAQPTPFPRKSNSTDKKYRRQFQRLLQKRVMVLDDAYAF